MVKVEPVDSDGITSSRSCTDINVLPRNNHHTIAEILLKLRTNC